MNTITQDVEISVEDERIDRSAFLFMTARKPQAQFAQCVTCAFFIAGKQRCENFGPANVVRARGSCGAYAFGPEGSKIGKPMCRMTPTEAGYVERKVRCEDCKFFDSKDEPQTHCDFYTQLNLMIPGVFNLNRYVSEYDCCNANMEGVRNPTVFGPLGPIMHANVIASDIELEYPTFAHDTRRMAFDRSMRRIDSDGRLHVDACRISKANVCPYLGAEIPGSEELGLEPSKIYNLYRDQAELEAAAHTYERVPLMVQHVAVSADNPQKFLVVGTVSNVRYVHPYLTADLSVWDQDAIDKIESGEQREISCGYRYKVDMTAGEVDGVRYDGVMRKIEANHVALVMAGRVGPDVLVADSSLTISKNLA